MSTQPCRGIARKTGSIGLPLVAFLLAAAAAPALAQETKSGDGFLFRPPAGAVAVRAGFDLASAGSDVFSFVTDELTVSRRDFSSASVALDVAFRVSPRMDALFSVGTTRATINSEFRHWLDNNDQPIRQQTLFQRVPLTGSIRAYLNAPGRSIGRFAWIPNRWAPYVGAGGGVMWYQFNQDGDFIDFNTLRVFPDRFESDGWAPTAHAFVGTDISLTARVAVTVEGRYQWASSPLSVDYKGFDKIDLSGFAVTSGIAFRY